jgi:hypothetical protein
MSYSITLNSNFSREDLRIRSRETGLMERAPKGWHWQLFVAEGSASLYIYDEPGGEHRQPLIELELSAEILEMAAEMCRRTQEAPNEEC